MLLVIFQFKRDIFESIMKEATLELAEELYPTCRAKSECLGKFLLHLRLHDVDSIFCFNSFEEENKMKKPSVYLFSCSVTQFAQPFKHKGKNKHSNL